MAAVLLIFGMGWRPASMAMRPMPMIATTSMMALIAGLATRWAALPRLAMPAIATLSEPFLVVIFAGKEVGRPHASAFGSGAPSLSRRKGKEAQSAGRARVSREPLVKSEQP